MLLVGSTFLSDFITMENPLQRQLTGHKDRITKVGFNTRWGKGLVSAVFATFSCNFREGSIALLIIF